MTPRVTLAHFCDYDKLFGSGTLVRKPKCNNAALAKTVDPRGQFLHLVRVQISAALDDDVLHATSDVNFAVRAIGAIAGVHPGEFVFPGRSTYWKKLIRCGRIFVVAVGRRWSAKPQKSLRALSDFVSFCVDDAYFVEGNSAAGS